jgi:predicted nucleotidyltransferase
VTARRFKRTVQAKNKFLDHHLGHVITIIRNAVANSDSFENIAEQLKKERLEEVVFQVLSKNIVNLLLQFDERM